ncbi:MAG: hypothetical protein ACI4OT_03975 [Bacilli bacterium]
MRRKSLIFLIFSLVITCSVISSNFSVNAANNKADNMAKKWCYLNWSTTLSAQTVYDQFSKYYVLDEWNNISSDSCVANDEMVTCNYSKKSNGYYMLAVDSESGTQYIKPDKDGKISFSITAPAGTEVIIHSYPYKVANVAISGDKTHKLGDACKVNGYKGDLSAETDINREYALFSVGFTLPSTKKNNFYSDTICVNFRNKYNKSDYKEYAASSVPECFDSKSDIDISTSYYDIQSKINEVTSTVSNLQNLTSDKKSDKVSSLYCQFNKTENRVSSSKTSNLIKSFTTVENIKDNEGNTWYKVVCTENMTIEYDSPKASYSSGGFKYTVKLNSTKSCSVFSVRQPTKPAVCRPSFYFTDTNAAFGGPSEDFDLCVNQCDGGIYSDECSNSCYEQVYEQKKSINNISFKDNNIGSFNNLEKLIVTSGTKNGKAWCDVESMYNPPKARSYRAGKNEEFKEWWWMVCPSARTKADGYTGAVRENAEYTKHSIQANPSNSSEVYGCVYGFQSEICKGEIVCNNNCSSKSVETKAQAEEEYENQKKLQLQAKNKIKNDYKCTEKDGSWECTDTVTTEEATANATITRTVNNVGKDVNFEGNQKPSISYSTKKDYSFINFPKAFISLENGSVLYKNQDSTNMLGYRFGGYLFYTDPDTTSANSNDIRYYPYNAETFGITSGIMATSGLKNGSTYGEKNNTSINWNIVTKIRNFGSDKQWNIDVNCFYGADVSLCDTDDPDCCEVGGKCKPVECKDCVSGNLPYRYRTVNLDDLFPDRNPGYNWTNNVANDKASVNGYSIDPESLISDVESRGKSIYNSSPYLKLSIGKNGNYNWNNIENDGLYTNFDNNYSPLTNGVNFYNSKYVTNHQKTNRTK